MINLYYREGNFTKTNYMLSIFTHVELSTSNLILSMSKVLSGYYKIVVINFKK